MKNYKFFMNFVTSCSMNFVTSCSGVGPRSFHIISFGSSDPGLKVHENYLFLINFVSTDSLHILLLVMVRFASLMANMRNPGIFVSPFVNAAWCMLLVRPC